MGYENLKAYFCNTCNRVLAPFELETLKNKIGEQEWGHKQCKTRNIIRVDKELNPIVSIQPSIRPTIIKNVEKIVSDTPVVQNDDIVLPKKKHRPHKQKESVDDLFE